MRTLKRFNSEIEVYSIDEAFLDLSNFPDGEVEKVGKEIRETVLQWTGIPTSIGIANTKTLSKVANHLISRRYRHLHLKIYPHLQINMEMKRIL